jgi:para-aminobenzoate synthetase component 1
MEFTHFSLNTYPNIKSQLLLWANQFNYFTAYDSNSHIDAYTKYDFLIAIDALDTYAEKFDIESFKYWKKNEFTCCVMSYEMNHHILSISTNNDTFIDFLSYLFYKPRYIIYIKEGRIYINRNYPEAIEILDQISNYCIVTNYSIPKISFKTDISEEKYIKTVHQIQDKILEGAFYELNYCIDFKTESAEIDAIHTFIQLNEIAQTPMAALVKMGKKWILSFSPERFVTKQGNTLIAQPIKGTARRHMDNIEDDRVKLALQQSEKERAENSMIVDLMRNDLTPYAKTGSIHVSEYCKIYSFKHVHQMISTIEATLENEEKAIDAILQCVPAGSMTGAPKKNVMKHIDTFETFKRGMYAGNIGYFDNNGDFDSNVVIRTIYYDEKIKKANFSVGSAITSQSIAIEEYKECLLKAQFILKAFGNE